MSGAQIQARSGSPNRGRSPAKASASPVLRDGAALDGELRPELRREAVAVDASPPIGALREEARREGMLRDGDALLVVDVQRDFMPGGRLAVPGAAAVLGPLNACLNEFVARRLPVFASRDWHPPGHCSFQVWGGPWPEHCVAGTRGAAFAQGLNLPPDVTVISKGSDFGTDAPSAFAGTDFHAQLGALGVRRLFIAGVATDYFALATAADARELGFGVFLLSDALAGIGARPADGLRAFERMQRSGAVLINSRTLQG